MKQRLAIANARMDIELAIQRHGLTDSGAVAILTEMAHRRAVQNARPPKGKAE